MLEMMEGGSLKHETRARVYVIKGLRINPLFFCVVYLEAAIWRDASDCISSLVET